MWQTILAAMLLLQQPGASIYSQVVVTEQAPAPCADSYSLLCQPPRWSEAHGAYTVAESWEQGVERYAMIARTIERVSSEPRWHTPPARLWRYLVALTYHESGWRRDVHEGIGPAARGDCVWRTVIRNGERVRVRVPGSCVSHCLGQINYGQYAGERRIGGYTADQIVGLDQPSTERCFELVALVVDRGWQACSRGGAAVTTACIVRNYAGTRLPQQSRAIRSRVATFDRLRAAPAISDRVRVLLGLTDGG